MKKSRWQAMTEEQRERKRRDRRAWYARNKVHRRSKERVRESREEFVAKRWVRSLYWRYKITPEQYEEILRRQNGVCAICRKHETVKDFRSSVVRRLAVDHDHVTGKIRGLLCAICNTAIGKLKDDPNLLLSAVEYLLPSGTGMYRTIYLYRQKAA